VGFVPTKMEVAGLFFGAAFFIFGGIYQNIVMLLKKQ